MVGILKAERFKTVHGVYEIKRATRKEIIKQTKKKPLMVIKTLSLYPCRAWRELTSTLTLGHGFQIATEKTL